MGYPKILKIVEVEWIDSSATSGWRHESRDDSHETDLSCKTVGYLYQQSKDRVSVALSLSATGSLSDSITIPRVAIKAINVLKAK